MHDVLMDVGDDAEAEGTRRALGGTRGGECRRGEGKLLDEPTSAETEGLLRNG
jgi:hypothetical protein